MDKHLLLILFSSCLWYQTQAQTVQDYLEKGDRFFTKKDYADAMTQYKRAYDLNPEDPHVTFRVGLTYLHFPEKSKALSYLLHAYNTKPHVDEDINYHLGLAYQHAHQYMQALEQFELFKKKHKKMADIAEHKIHEVRMADSLSKRPIQVVIENVGNVVNTPHHDYSPIITPDGSKMIFTSNRPSEDEGEKPAGSKWLPIQENFEDIYVARNVNGYWSAPQKIGPNINIKFHDAAASMSHDGNTLFLYYEQGSGDIYTSTFDGMEWSKPVALNKNVNSPFWETSACMSADGQKLFFTSSRPGGLGELDIYVCERDPATGDWGKVVNLGDVVNTRGNEDSPFIHPDGNTLYFTSNGHPTMGSSDIFVSFLKDGVWSKPRNLGYPVNSIEYDGFFTISADKKTGYYTTMREDGYGDTDIYRINFLEIVEEEKEAPPVVVVADPEIPADPSPIDTLAVASAAPQEIVEEHFIDPLVQLHKDLNIVTVLKGKVIDAGTAQPLDATITLVNNENNEVMVRIKSNKETGDFELHIPHGGNYGVATERKGYLFNSINFNVPQFAEYQEIDTHIIMVKAEVGSKAVLKNIFFDTGHADLKPESISELHNIIELLEHNPNVKVQINGHTDNVGDEAHNKVLSLKRATAVVDYLIEKGVDASKLSAVGYGEERPLVSNDDEKGGRELNRRTEIEIIGIN